LIWRVRLERNVDTSGIELQLLPLVVRSRFYQSRFNLLWRNDAAVVVNWW
jgi:hypothetical protein